MYKRTIPKEILICPNCKSGKLMFDDKQVLCKTCSSNYTVDNGCYYFFANNNEKVLDGLDKIKTLFKKFNWFYDLLIYFISPVFVSNNQKKFIKKNVNSDMISVNLGSGNTVIGREIYNIDLFPYKNVDLTCDITSIPLKTNSVDIVFNLAVLEHIPDPELVVNEIFRILKKGGVVYSFFPFIQGFHASPYDFSRRTLEGMKVLFNKFEQIDLKPAGGPTSGMLWILQEWLAILFSFGIKPLYLILYFFMMVITSPLKFLDIILIRHPMAKNISSGFIYIGRKNHIEESDIL